MLYVSTKVGFCDMLCRFELCWAAYMLFFLLSVLYLTLQFSTWVKRVRLLHSSTNNHTNSLCDHITQHCVPFRQLNYFLTKSGWYLFWPRFKMWMVVDLLGESDQSCSFLRRIWAESLLQWIIVDFSELVTDIEPAAVNTFWLTKVITLGQSTVLVPSGHDWQTFFPSCCFPEQRNWDPDARGAGEGDKWTLHCE